MTVKDSRTEEERGNAADLLKLVMVRKKDFCTNIFSVVSVLGASRQNITTKAVSATSMDHLLRPYNFLFLGKSASSCTEFSKCFLGSSLIHK